MKSIFDLFLRRNSCAHTHALVHTNEGYCPECGAYVKKYFYIVRCSRCEVKREAKMCFGEVEPKERFCTNCGSKDFYVEKLDSISFIDVAYAIHTKEVVEPDKASYVGSEIWFDNEKTQPVRLLTDAG